MGKKLSIALSLGCAGAATLAAVVVDRTRKFRPQPVATASAAVEGPETVGAAERFARGLTYQTISYQKASELPVAAFEGFIQYLAEAFPRVHATLRREVVGGYSLLYTWTGTESGRKGICILGHHDVVPVLPGTESQWTQPPFGGVVADGFIWGRGALDNKAPIFASLEAVEALLAAGFQPKRDVYLAFGHDEEMGGQDGAVEIAKLLKSRGVEVEFVIDEGGAIESGVVEGVAAPVALVGIAEKGYVSVELTVKSAGGHSSMPPAETAIGVLSRAITRLEDNPMPAKLAGVARLLFERVGPYMPLTKRIGLANLWLFGPVVLDRLAQSPNTNAMIRSTTAPTMLQGSIKDNVLPIEAKAIVNFRILAGDTVASVLEHIRRVVGDDRVEAQPIDFPTEPSPVSDVGSASYRLIERKVRELFPGTVVAPYLVLGQTDSRCYAPISENVYRFLPIRMTKEDIARIHATDERISVGGYHQLIRFLWEIIRESAG